MNFFLCTYIWQQTVVWWPRPTVCASISFEPEKFILQRQRQASVKVLVRVLWKIGLAAPSWLTALMIRYCFNMSAFSEPILKCLPSVPTRCLVGMANDLFEINDFHHLQMQKAAAAAAALQLKSRHCFFIFSFRVAPKNKPSTLSDWLAVAFPLQSFIQIWRWWLFGLAKTNFAFCQAQNYIVCAMYINGI